MRLLESVDVGVGREDGAYGPLALGYDIDDDGNNDSVDTLLDLNNPNTKVYEAHGAITQEWADKLIAVSASYASVPVAYDRLTGAVTRTVGDIADLNRANTLRRFTSC